MNSPIINEWLKRNLRIPETNLQAEFYCVAKELGMNVLLEMGTKYGRIDITVFSYDMARIVAVVECKINPRNKVEYTAQIERYKQLGVPVFGLADFYKVRPLAIKIRNHYVLNPSHQGVTLTSARRVVPHMVRDASGKKIRVLPVLRKKPKVSKWVGEYRPPVYRNM